MDNETKKEFENLARMVKSGFDQTGVRFARIDGQFTALDTRMDGLDTRMERVENRMGQLENRVESGFENVNARLLTIERDIAEIRAHFVYREEFEDLMARVKYLETKLGVDSGK